MAGAVSHCVSAIIAVHTTANTAIASALRWALRPALGAGDWDSASVMRQIITGQKLSAA